MIPSTKPLLGDASWSRPALTARLAALELTPLRRANLRDLWPMLSPKLCEFLSNLYGRFQSVPALAGALSQDARVARMIEAQGVYVQELYCDEINLEYVRRRAAIGIVHHKLRVTPQWYLAVYAHHLSWHIEVIQKSKLDSRSQLETILTLFQSIVLDASVVLDSYGRSEDAVATRHGNPQAYAQPSPHPNTPMEVKHKPNPTTMSRLPLTLNDTNLRQEFVGLTVADAERLRLVRDPVGNAIPAMLSSFYEMVVKTPELNALLPVEQIERLIRQVDAYWREFLNAKFDRSHAASRMRVGVIHERIGLEPQWYLLGLAHQVAGLVRAIPTDIPDYAETLIAFLRGVIYDITFVIDSYMSARAETLVQLGGYANRLMSGLTAAVAIVDERSRVIFANEQFVTLAGVEPGLLYMMPLEAAIPLQSPPRMLSSVRQSGGDRATELEHRGEITFRITVTSLHDEQTHLTRRLAVVIDDVSSILHLSRHLERDVQQYTRLANAVPGVLWELELATDTLVSLSQQVQTLLGYRDIALLGRESAWIDCIVPEDRDRFLSACRAIIPGQERNCEYRMLRADNREIWVRSHLLHSSDPKLILAVTVDITAVKMAESRKMEALGQAAGGIAHVLNNALTIMLGFIDLHQAEHAGKAEDGYLALATSAGRRAAGVVEQLLAFAGRQFLQPRPQRLPDLISNWLPRLRQNLGSTIRLTCNIPAELWMVHVDARNLESVLDQLCDNARLAMPQGGEITLSGQNIPKGSAQVADATVEGDWVELSICDTGSGMSEEIRQRVIEPFFTTHNMASRVGLGLSFVHGSVTQCGGHMIVRSEPGQGTTVVLRFPRLILKEEIGSTKKHRPICLLVEDDEPVRKLTSVYLERLGYDVHSACNSASALRIADQHPIDLLLSDVFLGEGLDGIALAHQLSRRVPRLRIILMSGYLPLNSLDLNLPIGWECLNKPFTLQDLNQALANLNSSRVKPPVDIIGSAI